MGALVMLLGKSGSGKTSSLRNFAPGEIGIMAVTSKPLPFRGGNGLAIIHNADYQTIIDKLSANKCRAYFIDDAGYLMANENFRRAKEKGYEKFTEMSQNFQQLLQQAIWTSPDTIVYFTMHTDYNQDGGEKPKVPGKMLEEKYCIEGVCSAVLNTTVIDGKYVFVTRSDGLTIAKPGGVDSPLPDVMDNDLKAVDTMLREYWGMKPLIDTNNEIGEQ